MSRKLAISEPTVRFHLVKARRKTGATSGTNLAALAPFTDVEIADFESPIVHVARALALGRAFFEIESANRVLQVAVGSRSTAIAVLDRSGAILQANLPVRAVLARNDGLNLNSRGRLVMADPAA